MRTNGGGNAIDKALAVLEALAEHSRVTDIAVATGLPKSTVHRILQTLIDRHYALYAGDGHYTAGPRILTLAGKVLGRFNPAQHVEGALRRLRDATGYTVHFALLDGDEAVYAAKLEGSRPYQMPSRVGKGIRLHSTGIGKAVLAQMADEEVTELTARTGLQARTPHTITDPAALLDHLATVRARGYALDEQENENGIRCIAAPVFGHTGAVIGGVSVSTLSLEPWKPPIERLAPQVIAAAQEISGLLGAPTP
ncbi:IclR family transcriptional regulator [Allostreptomyces psammosilenae]|uniref:DNA-binding IclR family transcriptional regulator n=1 Tax=Allostreptomyces psammosilenae TaxID=1892865 RepID=A0A852ZWM2_9ACTN|nr:IclR family transcriptional regulator [Allostreptomyces psammosilenae]NYI06609.1 DNA-binding IclR family transcriptional regulator [Allostreptomyces psammosilenae]